MAELLDDENRNCTSSSAVSDSVIPMRRIVPLKARMTTYIASATGKTTARQWERTKADGTRGDPHLRASELLDVFILI